MAAVTTYPASELLTVNQAGEYAPALGVRYVRRLIIERRIPVYRIGGRVFVAKPDLDALAASGRQEAEGAIAGVITTLAHPACDIAVSSGCCCIP